MATNKRQQLLNSLENEEYRREYAADVGTGLAFQIHLLREKRKWTQEDLATRMGKRQETISQWENPTYGRYTLNTLKELAAAFDVALTVRFIPFSELVDWSVNLDPERLAPKSFEEERRAEKETVSRMSTSDVVSLVHSETRVPKIISVVWDLIGLPIQRAATNQALVYTKDSADQLAFARSTP